MVIRSQLERLSFTLVAFFSTGYYIFRIFRVFDALINLSEIEAYSLFFSVISSVNSKAFSCSVVYPCQVIHYCRSPKRIHISIMPL